MTGLKPTPREVQKARKAKIFRELTLEFGLIQVVEVTGGRVVFRYAGHTIDFINKEGRVSRGHEVYTYLSEEDYIFLFKLAEMLMKAVVAGYKSGNKKRRKKETKPSDLNQLTMKI